MAKGMKEHSLSIGWTTTGTQEEATRIARDLVDAGWVACAQISPPVTSVYRWQGQIETTDEFRVILKFSTAMGTKISKWLETNHSYDTPQWVSCRIDSGSEKYLNWLMENSS